MADDVISFASPEVVWRQKAQERLDALPSTDSTTVNHDQLLEALRAELAGIDIAHLMIRSHKECVMSASGTFTICPVDDLGDKLRQLKRTQENMKILRINEPVLAYDNVHGGAAAAYEAVIKHICNIHALRTTCKELSLTFLPPPPSPIITYSLEGLVGLEPKLTTLKLTCAHYYTFSPQFQAGELEVLELISFAVPSRGRLPANFKDGRTGAVNWQGFRRFLGELQNLQRLCLGGVLPKAVEHVAQKIVDIPKLCRLELYDEVNACGILCGSKSLVFPGRDCTQGALRLRLAQVNQDQSRDGSALQFILSYIPATREDLKLQLRSPKAEWAPTDHHPASTDVTISLAYEALVGPSHSKRPAGCTANTLLEMPELNRNWLGSRLVQWIPLPDLRSLSIGGPGSPDSHAGISLSVMQIIIDEACAIQELTLVIMETCWTMCNTLYAQAMQAAKALKWKIPAKDLLKGSIPGLPSLPKILASVRKLVLVDADFAYASKERSSSGNANSARGQQKLILSVADLIHDIFFIGLRWAQALGQEEAPIGIIVCGAGTRLSEQSLLKLQEPLCTHVEICGDVPGHTNEPAAEEEIDD